MNGGLEVNKNKPAKLERTIRVAKVTGAGHHVSSTNYSPTHKPKDVSKWYVKAILTRKRLTDKASSKAARSQNAKMKHATINYTPDHYSHRKPKVSKRHVKECPTCLTKHTKFKQIRRALGVWEAVSERIKRIKSSGKVYS